MWLAITIEDRWRTREVPRLRYGTVVSSKPATRPSLQSCDTMRAASPPAAAVLMETVCSLAKRAR